MNVLRLGALTSDDRYRVIAERALRAYAVALAERPVALTEMLLALDFYTDSPREVVLVWPAGAPAAEPFIDVLRKTFLPNRAVAAAAEGAPLEALAKLLPFAEGKRAIDGKPTAYVCEKGICALPTSDPSVFAAELKKVRPLLPGQ
jgi:hypothetical protein